ncbi:MAG: DUF4386 family protein [Thermoleophilaceae bacterium]|nr:DUF4386 family protein [Thermoleophilaceae bacterium]
MDESVLPPEAPAPLPQLTAAEISAEAQRGKLAGYFALGAAVAMISSIALLIISLSDTTVKTNADRLLSIAAHKPVYIAASALAAIASAAMAPLLIHLALAIKQRIPQMPRIVQTLALIGPLLVALSLPLQEVIRAPLAADFAAQADHSLKAANDALKETSFQVVSSIGLAGSIALGFAMVMISIYGMRAGLLTRFMGIIGAIIGFATVVPVLGSAGILQVFWLCAVAVMLLGPAERQPPAWAAGKAMPWIRPTVTPTGAEAPTDSSPDVIDAAPATDAPDSASDDA